MAGRGRGRGRGAAVRGARGGAAVRGGGRGRGRGAARGGRGRGAGRGRGRGRGRGQAHQVAAATARAPLDNFDLPDLQYDEKWDDEDKEEGAPVAPQDLSTQTLKELLLSEAKLAAHMDAIMQEGDLYVEVVHKLVERKMASKWSTPIKGRILAACLAAHRTAAVDYLLKLDGVMGLAEMVKAVQLLDAPRRVRQLEKKLATLVARAEKDPKSVKSKTIAELKTDIHNASIELVPNHKLSVSGACARRLRKWVEAIPASTLEFWLLFFPPEPWRAFADVAHLSPKNFAVDYFLPVVYGADAPAGTLVAAAQKITRYNLEATLKAHPQLAMNYAFVRKKLKDGVVVNAAAEATIKAITEMGFSKHQAQVALNRPGASVSTQELVEWIVENGAVIERTPMMEEAALMPEGARIFFALHAPLEDVLWNYEELECKEAEGIVMGRLAKGETLESAKSRLNYGKLMERLLYFRERGIKFAEYLLPYAQDRLKRINVPRVDELKLAVFGDASGSMEVAIKCATTLGSLLSVALNARLSFFNSDSFLPPVVPRTAEEVLKVVETVKADGGTSMASALWPFYANKQPLDFIIVVSDEGENEDSHGHMLAPLFKRYREEVAPRAKLMLVSFVHVGDEGHLKKQFDKVGVSVKQVRLDGNRPDTSKFDAVLGLVTLEMTELHERRDLIINCLQRVGITRDPAGLILQY